MKFFRKRKWTHNRLKCLKMHHLHPFFRNVLGEVPGPHPVPHPSSKGIFPNAYTPPYRFEVGLQPPPAVDLVSGSIIDNAMYIFNAILLKIQLSLSEFKGFIYTADCTILHNFFKIFSGEAPRTPTKKGGDTPPVPSPLGPSGLEQNPPRLCSESATGWKWIFWLRYNWN